MAIATSTESRWSRRNAALALTTLLVAPAMGLAATPGTSLKVWKEHSCGCCQDWVAHMEVNGSHVKVHESGDNAVRAQLRIDKEYGSCHTAVVDGYAVKGHVPARKVRRLLNERPAAIGLPVPGMPVGSPGMDGAVYGGRKDAYTVMLLARDGTASVYQAYLGSQR